MLAAEFLSPGVHMVGVFVYTRHLIISSFAFRHRETRWCLLCVEIRWNPSRDLRKGYLTVYTRTVQAANDKSAAEGCSYIKPEVAQLRDES